MKTNSIWWLHVLGWIEGISWVLLAFVAVPLKYLGGNESLVKILGPVHGGLFTLFCLVLAMAWGRGGWPFSTAVKIFLSSLIPFGWFIYDRWLKAEARRTAAL